MTEQVFNIEISATAVAWYGAIVATISVAVALFNYLRDRAKIKIKYRKNMKMIGAYGPYNPSKIYFNITVINKGRRPINITKAALRDLNLDKKKKFNLLSDSFFAARNQVLTEQNPTTDFFVEQDLIDFSGIWYIVVYGGAGQRYKKYFHIFPTFWRIWYFLRFKK